MVYKEGIIQRSIIFTGGIGGRREGWGGGERGGGRETLFISLNEIDPDTWASKGPILLSLSLSLTLFVITRHNGGAVGS